MGIWTEERRKEKKSKKKGKVAEVERQNVMKTLMSTYGGRQFVYNILDGCGLFYVAFTPNALGMAYDHGKRFIGFQFLKDINDKCPEYYVQMIKEANERSTDDSDRTSDSTDSGSEFAGGEDAGGPVEGGDGTVDPDAPDPHGYYIGRYRP